MTSERWSHFLAKRELKNRRRVKPEATLNQSSSTRRAKLLELLATLTKKRDKNQPTSK